jgi:hypothetical protein
MKTFLALVVAALVAAPVAAAAGGPLYAMQGGTGIPSLDGKSSYVAVGTMNNSTLVETIGRDGSLWSWPEFVGSYGIPTIGFNQPAGLSHDGRTLVLESTAVGSSTDFLVLDTRSGRARTMFFLNGSYSFDALSPDASKLYLVQHMSSNLSHYVVRAYDLRTGRLLPGRIADRTQKSWVMRGDPVTRATTTDGRWVYTLYQNYGGYPFIHALDTVRGVAHCIGIPWSSTKDQSALGNLVLTPKGGTLAVDWKSGKSWLRIDTSNWRLSHASGSGFPWRYVGPVVAAGALLVLQLLLRRRRREAEGTLLARAA